MNTPTPELNSLVPRLRVLTDGGGWIAVVDDADRAVATFCVLKRDCYVPGATSEELDRVVNSRFADAFVHALTDFWTWQARTAAPPASAETPL